MDDIKIEREREREILGGHEMGRHARLAPPSEAAETRFTITKMYTDHPKDPP
jgi:hypothetical protein